MALPCLLHHGQVEGNHLKPGGSVHDKELLPEGINDHALTSVGNMPAPVATIDPDNKDLIFQCPGIEGNTPETYIFACPGAGNKQDPGSTQRKSPGLFRKFCIETDQDT